MEQRSREWFAARAGKVTASRVADIVARTKSGYSSSRANYMAELLCERMSGQPAERFQSSAMVWGTDTEPLARQAYEVMTGQIVDQIGFVLHPTIPNAGASPDGLVGDDGLVEFKCPNSATHLETLLSARVPERYISQIYMQMACLPDRKWCDYISYDPRFPDNMRLFCRRIVRNENAIRELEGEIRKFLDELELKISDLTAKYPKEDDHGV